MNKEMLKAFLADVAAVLVGLLLYDYVRQCLIDAGYHPQSPQRGGN